ncbi:hypothetical protein BASA81_004443 [Batrachochytrium salamandrivorans]|nr:hypothetical protein BASA81_004443 [Batrachochytrium salamandrivorans]
MPASSSAPLEHAKLDSVFDLLGVPLSRRPEPEELALALIAVLVTLVVMFFLSRTRQRKRLQALRAELALALESIDRLEEELEIQEIEEEARLRTENKQIRVWMDGAFDMFHYGHMNAFRQGRSLGTYLIVGVNDDASIKECKGTAPVMNDEERIASVTGCRFVDEIVPHCPYVMSPEYLNMVIEKYQIDYVVHGDDPCIVDGKDVYQDAKDRGIYREIPRTTGVSTTDIVGRMLILSRDHHDRARKSPKMGSLMSKQAPGAASKQMLLSSPELKSFKANYPENMDPPMFVGSRSKFLTTGRMIRIFSQQCKEPKPTDRIVYIDGAWDMFHSAHVETLRKARELGDYLIVGVHNDDLVNSHRGSNYPIMNLNERVLSVLGCRYVDDVLIDAPWDLTREMIAGLNISLVATGTMRDCRQPEDDDSHYYKVPRELGLLRYVESEGTITVEDIVDRILSQETMYQKKLAKKSQLENDYYSNRFGFEVTEAVAVGANSMVTKTTVIEEQHPDGNIPSLTL